MLHIPKRVSAGVVCVVAAILMFSSSERATGSKQSIIEFLRTHYIAYVSTSCAKGKAGNTEVVPVV